MNIMLIITTLLTSFLVTAYSFNWNREYQPDNSFQQTEPIETQSENDKHVHRQPIYQPLYRDDVQNLLEQKDLRAKFLPGLKYRKAQLTSSQTGKLSSLLPQFKLPKLILKPVSLSIPQKIRGKLALTKSKLGKVIEAPKKTNFAVPGMLADGEFPFKPQKSKPIWLMAIGDVRPETCKTKKYNRTITSKGCKSLVIESKFCTGRCNSFFVPSQKADFQSCSSCFPSKHNLVKIMLECPGRRRGYKMKQIQLIEECKCQSVLECPYK